MVDPGGVELAGRVTLSLTETPAMDALKLIAELGGMELEVRDYAIVFLPRSPVRPPRGRLAGTLSRNPPPQPRFPGMGWLRAMQNGRTPGRRQPETVTGQPPGAGGKTSLNTASLLMPARAA